MSSPSKDTPLPIPVQPDQPSPRSTPSLSSTSSIESSPYDDYSHIFVPNKTRSFSSIPFAWEKLPGIPKRQLSKSIQDPSLNLLPLPPSMGTPTTTPSKKYSSPRSNRKDPFFKAFVECSKDGYSGKDGNFGKGSVKITRSLSDRFGFVNMYTSCKRSCSVSDSLVYFPKPRKCYLFN